MVSPVVDPAVLDKENDATSLFLRNATGSPAFGLIEKRVKGAGWPYDPPGMTDENPDWVKIWDPSRYNCDSFASRYNRVPPMLKAGTPPDENGPENAAFSNRLYDATEIYIAFRQGALALMNIMMDPATADQHRVAYNGLAFPRPYANANDYHVPLWRIGLGSWRPRRAQRELPLAERTTVVHEWPLINGGNYPYPSLGQEEVRNPGFDRVLFQLVRGRPIYVGVISQRRDVDHQASNHRARGLHDTFAYPVYEASGRRDMRLVESGVYPGLASNTERGPGRVVLKHNRAEWPVSPIHQIDYTPLPPSSPSPPPPDPDGDGGAPAGGSGGRAGPVGPGGYSKSGGGTAGPQGGFEQYAAPMPGNPFKAGWNLFIPGPSHFEL
ncbi:hypothetical protein PG991_013977 [Apiospora marii]|uniref:Uncharacterized protein n=1 Tax=Apiospora marii TaxID=335849 RepID=A0ABR1R8I1_9PEZI